MHKEVNIVTVKHDELTDLCTLSRQTFIDAFIDQNKPENIFHFVDRAYTPAILDAQLKNPASAFYFAKTGITGSSPSPLGYMKINFNGAQSEINDPKALEIERIYVASDYLSLGIGQQLLNKAIAIAKQQGLEYIWLGVWEHNLKAREFYKKNGFSQFDQHIFTLGDDDQTDLLLKKIL